MAIGKSKKQGKSKKGGKKKVVDPMTRKEWFTFRAPAPFDSHHFGNKQMLQQEISTEQIKGRVVEMSYSDLKKNTDQFAWRKVKLFVEEVEGKTLRTSFYGVDMTRDKLCQFMKKRQTTIESFVDVKTQDGYVLRCFVIGFTCATKGQICKTSYAKTSQIKLIRKKIQTLMLKEGQESNIVEWVKKVCSETIGEKIIKDCSKIYPMQNVLVRKIKLLKKPALDSSKLDELYKAQNVKVENKEGEVQNQEEKLL